MRFLTMPIRNLRRHPARTYLTCAIIAAAVASFIALVGISRGLERAWITSLEEKGTHILAVRKGAIEILTASIDEAVADNLRSIDGVAGVSGELLDLVELETGDVALLSGWPSGSYFWQSLHILEGKLPDPDHGRDAIVGQTLAAQLGCSVNDTILLQGREFRICGISRHSSVISNGSIVLPLPAMQELMERTGKVTSFNIRVDHPGNMAAVSTIRGRLAAACPELSFNETGEIAENNHVLRLLRATAWSTSFVALAMALIVVVNTLLMTITERTYEIGVLSAVGWRSTRIMAMVVLEGLLMAALGTLCGALLGIGTLHWLVARPEVYGLLEPRVTPAMIVEIAAAALLLGFLGSIYPAWRAVRLNPVEALRRD
jgi:putative ABC transport system permease protein